MTRSGRRDLVKYTVMKITPKQRAFADEYVANGFNGTQAYRKAYPRVKSDDVAGTLAARLLGNDRVALYVAHSTARALAKSEVTQERVLKAIAEVAFGSGKDTDKLRALELLGKHLGIFGSDSSVLFGPALIVKFA